MPVDIRNTPFIAQNGTHYVAAMTYSESSFSVSSTFSDFIGLPNVSTEIIITNSYETFLRISTASDTQQLRPTVQVSS
jgi:hypothetical protein